MEVKFLSKATVSYYFSVLQDGRTALMLASQNGHTEVVKCLIEAKASPDLQAKVNYV